MIVGDVNHFPTSDLETTLNLSQMVKVPTRGGSILDKIFMDQTLREDFQEPITMPNFGNSDHMAVYMKPVQKKPNQTQIKKVFDYRDSNIATFVETLKSQPWQRIYQSEDSIDLKCDLFYGMVNESLKCIPFSLVRMTERDKPWITPVLKVLINLRYDSYRQGQFEKYKHYKAKIRREITKAKAAWMEKLKREPHGVWKAMKTVSCKETANLQHFTNEFSLPIDAADALNSAFSSVFTKQSVHHEDALLPAPGDHEDWKICVSIETTQNLIKKLKLGKAAGNDGLTPHLLKSARDVIAAPLTHLFACSISSRSVPSRWKQAIVVPIPKVKNPSVSDFRPISLLPIPSKMLETLVLNSVKQEILNTYGDNQFGFRPGSSTLDAHLAIHEEVTRKLDLPETCGVAMIAMDLSKAFDRLSHQSLIQTLIDANLPHDFICWIKDFLHDRSQTVCFEGVNSRTTLPVTSGVPQGSILAPYLFAC